MATPDVEVGNNGIDQIWDLDSVGAARALWGVGSFTLVVDTSAAFYQPPRGPVFGGHPVAYYSLLAAILVFVAVEMITAYCLSRSGQDHGRGFLAFAKGLLCFAVALLLIVVAIGGFALTVRA